MNCKQHLQDTFNIYLHPCFHICPFVCWLVCDQGYTKTTQSISTKLGWRLGLGQNLSYLGSWYICVAEKKMLNLVEMVDRATSRQGCQ